ncbi:glycosyl hydrolase [Mucilaginibacter segetis]|uniref:GH26 domain-containing protein n=1 Tax=Mucilaginibacter segetis TaxID=2793071 RepID=A0A934UNF6_9SPHI|nr:glycosyl hydrolase [Mucilaginibacter segetis]MBK0379851.1 hypothetical protein [Mucilaginibacter segetis]
MKKKLVTLLKNSIAAFLSAGLCLSSSCTKDVSAPAASGNAGVQTTNPRAATPVGKSIVLRGFNGKYLSGENGAQAVTCTRPAAGSWETFLVVDAGGGKVALKSQGKYLSSENGTQAVTCNRTSYSTWEMFDWVESGNGKISLRGNNGKYISSENGTQAVTCNRATASDWEYFTYQVVPGPLSFKSLNYLYSISGQKTVAGQQGMQYWQPMKDISNKYPGLWGEDFSFQPFQGTSTMAQWRSLVTSTAKTRWNSGALIALMFHACPPTQAEPCQWDGGVKSHLSDSQWNELITNGTTLNNNWKARLDLIATYLQDLKNNGVEVLFRPFHEMNQGVFWWAGRPGPNGTAKLYQITHDYLVNTKGLTNLIWVWNLQDFGSLSSDLNSYDPGSSYWDVLALDNYGSDGTGFTTTKYNLLLNKAGSKPIAIGECGTLPTSSLLASQPRWVYLLGWAELTQQQNSNSAISGLYNAGNVFTLDEMTGWQ